MKLTWEQVARWRLRRQQLHERAPHHSMLDVASSLCGLHAQLMSSAELTLWARVDGLQPGDVARALWEERTLFKTWAMRGTLHLLPSAEHAMWRAGWSTYDHYTKKAWFKYFGIDGETLQRVIDTTGVALDGQTLTREQLAVEVGELTGEPWVGEKLRESWGALLKPASFQGKLCFGPNIERNVSFTNPASWLAPNDPVDTDSALDAITRRFLAANGPAIREDYARWWGGPPAAAGARIKRLGDEVAEVDVEGTSMWLLAEHLDDLERSEPTGVVNLLPGFDQYVIGAPRHASKLIAGTNKARIYRPQGWISPVLLIDGVMAGVWKSEKKGNRLEVSIEPFVDLPGEVIEAINREAESLARFQGAAGVEVGIPA